MLARSGVIDSICSSSLPGVPVLLNHSFVTITWQVPQAHSPTIPVDTGNGAINSDLHYRGTSFEFCDMFSLIMFDKRNFAQCCSPTSIDG